MVTQVIPSTEVIQPAVDPNLLTTTTPEPAIAPAPSATTPAVQAPSPETSPQLPFTPSEPSEVQILRQKLAQVEAAREAAETETALTQEAQQVYQEEMSAGQTEADARRIAARHLTLARRVHGREQQLRMQHEILQGKQNAAIAFGSQYGVSPTILMSAESPQQMRDIAEREKRYAGMERDLQVLKRGQVPAQTLNANGISQAGGPAVTADNIDALHLEGKVSDEAYRNFLSTGQLR